MIALVEALLPLLSTVIGAMHACRFYTHQDEDTLILCALYIMTLMELHSAQRFDDVFIITQGTKHNV